MEEKTKIQEVGHSRAWQELLRRAETDPERAKQLKAAEQVMARYRETLRRLADS